MLNFDSSSTKVCLRYHRRCFFSSEKELFSWTYLLKEAPRRTKLLISPVCDTLFEDIQVEVECSKNYFKISFSQKVGASGNNIKKEPQKPRPKLKKYKTEYLQRIFTLPAIQCKCNFEFIKQPLKFSDFEGSIKIVQMISFPNPVSTLRSLRWMRKRLLNERNNESNQSNQSNIFRLIWFMLSNFFWCFVISQPARKCTQKLESVLCYFGIVLE